MSFGTKYSKMDQVKFEKDNLKKIRRGMVCFKQIDNLELH